MRQLGNLESEWPIAPDGLFLSTALGPAIAPDQSIIILDCSDPATVSHNHLMHCSWTPFRSAGGSGGTLKERPPRIPESANSRALGQHAKHHIDDLVWTCNHAIPCFMLFQWLVMASGSPSRHTSSCTRCVLRGFAKFDRLQLQHNFRRNSMFCMHGLTGHFASRCLRSSKLALIISVPSLCIRQSWRITADI